MIRALLLAMLAITLTAAAASRPVNPRDFALRIVSATAGRGSICSATAVGPHEIETAAHCLSYPLRMVNDKPATLVSFRKVADDRVRATIAGVTFAKWARYGKAVQGERVRFWGQPLGRAFIERVGYVAAVYPDGLLVDTMVCAGDSGSGLFSDAGELIGVVSFMSDANGCTFAGAR